MIPRSCKPQANEDRNISYSTINTPKSHLQAIALHTCILQAVALGNTSHTGCSHESHLYPSGWNRKSKLRGSFPLPGGWCFTSRPQLVGLGSLSPGRSTDILPPSWKQEGSAKFQLCTGLLLCPSIPMRGQAAALTRPVKAIGFFRFLHLIHPPPRLIPGAQKILFRL